MNTKFDAVLGKLREEDGEYAGMVQDVILSGQSVTIPENYQQIIYDSLTVEGTLTIEGRLAIIPDNIIS
jgi:hypothetical protein